MLTVALAACRAAEPPGAAEARARKALYEKQIAGLEEGLERLRRRGLSRDSVFIGVDEAVFREVVGAMLPLETPLGDHVRLRLERAEPFFRYTQGVLVFDGRLISVGDPDLFLAVRLAGGLDRVDFEGGRLAARVRLYHFEVQGTALGDLGRTVVEGLVRDNMDSIADVIPPIEIPVRLEEGLAIKGFGEGPVSVKPGRLPFQASVARVSSFNGRLWITVEIVAGPWQAGPEGAGGAAPAPGPSGRAPGAAAQGPA